MRHGQHLVPRDKSGRSVKIGRLLWSSANTTWSGFRLEIHRLAPSMHVCEPHDDFAPLSMCLSGISQMEMQVGKVERRSVSAPGAFVLSHRGFEYKSYSWSGSAEQLVVELDLARIRVANEDDYFPSELSPSHQFLIRDPHVAFLLLKMMAEAKSGCPSGSIFAQSISVALGAYILGRYTSQCTRQTQSRAKLSGMQLSRIRDYVHANISSDLSLHELARDSRLGAPRLCQLLKNTLDLTPHQYVVRERIFESLSLLSSGRMSISEVALATGFADQSHFTNVFKKVTSITPKRYQLERRHPLR
jgi:AraC family transcriptional regulator